MNPLKWLESYKTLLILLWLPDRAFSDSDFSNDVEASILEPSTPIYMWIFILILSIGFLIVLWKNHKLRVNAITQAQTKEALTNSQFLLEEAQQMAHLGNWELDPQSMKAKWSDEIFRIFNLPYSENVGPDCLATILYPDDRDGVLTSIFNAANNCCKHHMEYRILRPDGELRWIDCRAEPILDQHAHFYKLRGVVQDITLRKMNELQLLEREQQVRDLLEFTAEAIYGLDLNGRCTFANPACINMLGYRDAEQLIGKNMHDLVHHSKNDGSPYLEQDCPIFEAFLKNKGCHVDNEVFWCADNSAICVEYWSYPINRDGKVTGAVVAFMDITERLRAEEAIHDSEERYRIIFEGAPEGVWVIGPDRRTIEVNKRLCEMIGYQREEMIKKKPIDFVDEKNKQIFMYQNNQIEQTSRREYEIELRHKNGHNIPTYFRANTLHTSSGNVLEAVAFVTDLSEQKVAEKALRRAQKMDALGQLTGGIAHDFNNILSIILGNLSLLKSLVEQDEQAYKRILTVEKSACRAADLTKQLLTFSRRQAAQVSVTNINQIILEMNKLIAGSLTPEVSLQQVLADDLWLTKIDPGDFEDALLNLIFNARDAMSNGGYLTIETSNTRLDKSYCEFNPGAKAGNYVQLVISDSGAGISLEQQEHIFDPFYTTKPQGKGTGLGLAMVYGFVKRSKGYIKVYSEQGIGTSFRVYLPSTMCQQQVDETEIKETPSLPRGNESILIVDDEVDLLELAEEFLAALGYQVFTAKDARQAIEILAIEPRIQLIFTDVVMPGGINGFELAEKARKLYPHIQVLLTSGFTGRALAKNGQACFSMGMLNKPYTQVELAMRVRELLGEPASKQLESQSFEMQNSKNIRSNEFIKLGIDEIDKDHEKIFALYSQCKNAEQNHAIEIDFECILNQLRKYIEWHFPREEAIMEKCLYPGLENHRQVHRMLIKQFEKLHSQLSQESITASQLINFINDWIFDHIKSMDNSFASFCQKKPEQIKQALQDCQQKGKL